MDEKAGDGEEINMAPEAKGQQMSTDKQNAGRIRSLHLYAGGRFMTLIEILIAIGILALGMMGIMSLVPVAIRHTSAALQNSTGGSVAQTAITSLNNYSLDVSDGDKTSFDKVDHWNVSGDEIAIPDSLVWADTPNIVDTEQDAVRYLVDGDTTRYVWHAALDKADNAGDYTAEITIWFKERQTGEDDTGNYVNTYKSTISWP